MNNECVFLNKIFLFVLVSGYAADNKTKQHAPFVNALTYFRVDQLKVFLNNSPVFFIFNESTYYICFDGKWRLKDFFPSPCLF